jgi:hypothetical protein
MRLAAVSVLGLGLLAGTTDTVLAQQATSFQLQLVAAQPEEKKCIVTFRAINRLGVNLEQVKFEIYIISTTDSFEGSNILGFPAIRSNKQKYAKFPLNSECSKIGRLDMNDFTECKGDKDYLELCNGKVELSTKVSIGFSDEPEG